MHFFKLITCSFIKTFVQRIVTSATTIVESSFAVVSNAPSFTLSASAPTHVAAHSENDATSPLCFAREGPLHWVPLSLPRRNL